MFGDRAVTAGEGRVGFGVNYVRATYDRLDGVDLGDGSLRSVALLAGSTPVATGATQLTITTDRYVSPRSVSISAAAVPGGRRMSGQSPVGSPDSTGGRITPAANHEARSARSTRLSAISIDA